MVVVIFVILIAATGGVCFAVAVKRRITRQPRQDAGNAHCTHYSGIVEGHDDGLRVLPMNVLDQQVRSLAAQPHILRT